MPPRRVCSQRHVSRERSQRGLEGVLIPRLSQKRSLSRSRRHGARRHAAERDVSLLHHGRAAARGRGEAHAHAGVHQRNVVVAAVGLLKGRCVLQRAREWKFHLQQDLVCLQVHLTVPQKEAARRHAPVLRPPRRGGHEGRSKRYPERIQVANRGPRDDVSCHRGHVPYLTPREPAQLVQDSAQPARRVRRARRHLAAQRVLQRGERDGGADSDCVLIHGHRNHLWDVRWRDHDRVLAPFELHLNANLGVAAHEARGGVGALQLQQLR